MFTLFDAATNFFFMFKNDFMVGTSTRACFSKSSIARYKEEDFSDTVFSISSSRFKENSSSATSREAGGFSASRCFVNASGIVRPTVRMKFVHSIFVFNRFDAVSELPFGSTFRCELRDLRAFRVFFR